MIPMSYNYLFLVKGAILNLQVRSDTERAKSYSDPEDIFPRILKNFGHAAALGIVINTFRLATNSQFHWSVILIPSAFVLACRGATFIANQIGTFSSLIETFEKNLGHYLDIATRIFSFALLLFLTPHAKAAPFGFVLATTIVALDLVDGFAHDSKITKKVVEIR